VEGRALAVARTRRSRPTDAELAILRVLWKRGPSTVREVHEALADDRGTGYTTTLKLMQIMTEKGLVLRDESARAHVYRPSADKGETQRHLIRDLMARAFSGSARRLIAEALREGKISEEEKGEIRKLLDG
jgi:predicted transcriptional regulator